MNLAAIPMWLRLWLALQVIFFLIDPFLAPQSGTLMRSLVWAMVMMFIGWAMWRRSKGAWLAAVVFAVWAVVGGVLTFLTWTQEGLTHIAAWFAFGLVISLAEMAVLLSPPARRWINEPSEPASSVTQPETING